MKMVAKLRDVDPEVRRDEVAKKINSHRTAWSKARKEYMNLLETNETTESAANGLESAEKHT